MKSNSSSFTDSPNNKIGKSYNGKVVWAACEAALCVMTLILLYICFCLAWFVKSNKLSLKNGTANTITGNRNDTRDAVSVKRRRLRALMKYACLFAAVSTLLKCAFDQLKFFYAWNERSNLVCETLYDLTDILIFAMAYAGIYAFLWMKQWLFYCDPVAVKFLYSQRLVYFNIIFISVVTLLSLAVAVVNWRQDRYVASNSTANTLQELADDISYLGCVAIYDMSDPGVQWPLAMYCALNATVQVTLLGLFVYPLVWDRINKWKHSKNLEQTLPAASQTSIARSVKSDQPSRNISPAAHSKFTHKSNAPLKTDVENDVLGRKHINVAERSLSKKAIQSIKRTIIWTSVCIFTDATLVAIFAVFSIGTPQVMIAIATDFDLLLNVICIVATYPSWNQIVFPICQKNQLRSNSPSGQFSSLGNTGNV